MPGRPGQASCLAKRFRRSILEKTVQHHGASRLGGGPPARMDGQRPTILSRPHPVADDIFADPQRSE